jgi:hypothetical protein
MSKWTWLALPAAFLTMSLPSVGLDCLTLVEHYQDLISDAPSSAMFDVFPEWEGAARLPYMVSHPNRVHSTDLICDGAGELERLRIRCDWTADARGRSLPFEVSWIAAVADPIAPGTEFVAELFARALKSGDLEETDLPGPYYANLEVTPFDAGGAFVLIVERDVPQPHCITHETPNGGLTECN